MTTTSTSTTGQLLTQAQARAFYQAMLALNDADTSARYSFTFSYENGDTITVSEDFDSWSVSVILATRESTRSAQLEHFTEHYENQAAFAMAYGVDMT